MHKLVDLGPQVPREPCMWKKLHMFLEQYPPEKEFPDTKRLAENNISRQRLTGYFEWEWYIILPITRPSCRDRSYVWFPCFIIYNDLIGSNHQTTNSESTNFLMNIHYDLFFGCSNWNFFGENKIRLVVWSHELVIEHLLLFC